MYPKNAASPPRIAIGAVVQIADGAVQTSGVSVVVRPEGGAESAGGGTIAYSAASGVVYYTPTQAETNFTAFCVIAYKAACIPAQVTVVTTASSTAGTAVLDSDAQAMVTAFNAMRSGNVFTAPALANAPTGGSGSGSGARTVTITVNDGTTVLENCIVRLTEGANTFTALTNSSGVAVFNLDDATYTVGITKPGYTYSGTSLVVNGTETATYSMTAISISNPTTGRVARRSIPVTVVDRVT